MSSPNVTVIIPAYNCAPYLRAALESVRAQTYRDFEVILVDDGSTDGTLELANELASSWPAMRVIHIEHAGLARARNVALEAMVGQWVALLDGDDLWLPKKLQKCMDYLSEHPQIHVVYHPMSPMSAEGKPLRGGSAKRPRQGWITEKLFHRSFIHDPSVVFHKRVVDECGPFDQSLPVCVGHEFWLRVSTQFPIGLVNEPLAQRRYVESSLTLRNNARSSRVKVEMLERFYFERGGREMLQNQHKALARLAKTRYAAARVFIGQRQYPDAAQYLAKAIRYCPTFVKSYPYYLFARLICLVKSNTRKLMNE
jgi:glycosyltransferase involved in cell wall biosynthesis